MKREELLIVIILFGLVSCKRVTQEQLIQEAVELKINQWRQSEMNSCRDRAMAKAEAYVDSFLLVNSLIYKLDTIPKLPKPVKPVKPPFKETPDTLKVDKLIKKE